MHSPGSFVDFTSFIIGTSGAQKSALEKPLPLWYLAQEAHMSLKQSSMVFWWALWCSTTLSFTLLEFSPYTMV